MELPPRFDVLGLKVSAIDMDVATSVLDHWVRSGSSHYVCVTGVHGVMESHRNSMLRRIHNEAGLVTPDGMPLVWMAHSLGFSEVRRVYGPDLMFRMSAISAREGFRNYYFGGKPGTAERLRAAMLKAHPNLNVVGTCSPPFGAVSEADDTAIVEQINRARPDIVWVGRSTPKQEYWMASHIERLNARVLVGVGAAFDFLSGEKPQAPAWMQTSGLEWFFRMCSEPQRLTGRYLKNNPSFIYHAFHQLMKRDRFPRNVPGKDALSTAGPQSALTPPLHTTALNMRQ